jgi:AraC-like DNA-binding protein
MAADALSDVLKTVRLTGATFFDVVAKAPWVAESPPEELILPKILPGAGHLIAYLAKLSELMFIEVVRRHLEALPPEQAGWLAGLRDPFVGKALSLMHAKPARNWTIEDLAKDVGLSRSVLAERFADLVGMPPMQYLAKWRMQVASGLLSSGSANMAAVAAEIGYGSEAAFSRAFKKVVGVPPSAWRRRLGHDGSRPMSRTVTPPSADPGSRKPEH